MSGHMVITAVAVSVVRCAAAGIAMMTVVITRVPLGVPTASIT